ncbi:beta-1,4-N-acetylglucosaminyltransferase [Paragonimus westermani]|uniref:UDP-N-acetylglucosamine transferase subunit ALG13 n=1 Tax=Paragonimus westermani TaxID=34504 RepID=A0A5J4P029_9TREM|nr:beta-1,4-N-acetylglucosaminyltransferase [Paragonimus westermani]
MKSVFVTVGSTSFDKLIEVTNDPSFYAALSWLGYTDLVVQFGRGATVPSPPSQASVNEVVNRLVGNTAIGCQTGGLQMLRLRAFRYKDSLDGEISSSSLVISHGGAATCLQALTPFGSRRLVVVVNDSLSGNHQEELAFTLARGGHAVVTSPGRLLSLLWNGMHDQSLYFNKNFPSDVKRFLGPSVSPEEAGFVGFHRGRPERLLSYLNRRLGI